MSDDRVVFEQRSTAAASNNLTAERLREIVRYEPDTGLAYWLKAHQQHPAGRLASKLRWTRGKKDYVRLKIGGHNYSMGRIAFLYMTGEWPTKIVDHEDRDKHNNKWSNLREATVSQNAANSPPKTALPKGVSWVGGNKKVYQAKIFVAGKCEVIGEFMCPEDAGDAYEKRAQEIYGEFAYIRPRTKDFPDSSVEEDGGELLPAEDEGWRDNWRGRRLLRA